MVKFKSVTVEFTEVFMMTLRFQSLNFQVNFGIALSCFVNT